MSPCSGTPSRRQEELFEAAYQYVLAHGLADLSLRPLAAAIGSSPRVLLYLYGSKEELVRALLARARTEELAFLGPALALAADQLDLANAVRSTWLWLAAAEHRALLCLWVEAYARSLIEPGGPWASFAAQTVADWLDLLAAAQPARRRRTKAGLAERTAALAMLRGALLDVLATGDVARTTAAVEAYIRSLPSSRPRPG
jgi:AcrR family transcriptional regulator